MSIRAEASQQKIYDRVTVKDKCYDAARINQQRRQPEYNAVYLIYYSIRTYSTKLLS